MGLGQFGNWSVDLLFRCEYCWWSSLRCEGLAVGVGWACKRFWPVSGFFDWVESFQQGGARVVAVGVSQRGDGEARLKEVRGTKGMVTRVSDRELELRIMAWSACGSSGVC